MSIFKLLKTATLCTISMAAVSTSYGADSHAAEGTNADHSRHLSQASLAAVGSAAIFGETTPYRPQEQDTMSVGSRVSTISQDRIAQTLRAIIGVLRTVPSSVTYPNNKVKTAVPGAQPTQSELVLTGVSNLAMSHNGLTVIANEGLKAQKGLAQVLAIANGEDTAEIKPKKDSVEGQIVALIEAKNVALKAAEAKLEREIAAANYERDLVLKAAEAKLEKEIAAANNEKDLALKAAEAKLEREIAAANYERDLALTAVEAKLEKAESSKSTWRVATFITGSVLAVVAIFL